VKQNQLQKFCLSFLLFALSLCAGGCTDEFYLSEKEAGAYQSVFATQSSANLTFDNLTGRVIDIQFDNSTGTPRIISTNLLTEMRRTELANLETGSSAVSLDRLRPELETQIDHWINGRLELYKSVNNDNVRLTQLSSVSVRFLNNPTFTYRPETQSIAFSGRVTITINSTIEVNALSSIVDFFLGIFGSSINGTYPLSVIINDLQLTGEASILSPFADAGRIRFGLTPQRNGTIDVLENGTSVPSQIRDGVRDLLSMNLSSRVDEIFCQQYDYFALSPIRLSQTTPGRLEVDYRVRTDWLGPETARPLLHIVARSSDGKLYHARKNIGGWSDYTAIPFPSPTPQSINNDPTIFHSGNGQLELAAVTQSYALVYSHLRDDSWGNFHTLNPGGFSPSTGYRGKPAVVASAPGQVEIIVADGNGNLRHIRRINGIWLIPAIVPLSAFASNFPAPYRDPVAVHVGNKIVLIFVDAQNRPRAIAFDLETSLWGQPASLNTQTTITYQPAAVASGDSRVDVVYVGTTGTPYHRVLDVPTANFVAGVGTTGISIVGAETNLGGVLNATPMLVASGYKQLELIGRANDNRIRHKHYVNALASFTVDGFTVNPGWQGWSGGLTDNLYGVNPATDGRVSEFAASATRTGKVELVARAYTTYIYTSSSIFQNEYEGNRYGHAPWKTVHWRGYDNAGTQTFLGRPALATVDRNFEVTFVGNSVNSPTTHFSQIAENNSAGFIASTTPIVRTSYIPVDPIILSSGPGIVDRIVLADDNKPRHDRFFNDGTGRPYTLTVPSGVVLTQMAATSYGNGLIELVALGNDGRLYHWRYRNSVWSNPTSLGNGITSAPALLHIGAGQLELFAIDTDFRFLRWRFTNNAWTSSIAVSSNFRINNQMFGQTVASSWGDGTVDVVVVNADTGALYQRRIGPGDEICTGFGCSTPRDFILVGGKVYDTPVLTAFSAIKLNVLSMGQNLAWYSNWSSLQPLQPVPPPRDPWLAWSGFEYIGGSEMVVGGAVHTGRNNFAAVAIHFDGRIYMNRYSNGRWTGFRQIVGQTPGMILRTPVILPSLASHGG